MRALIALAAWAAAAAASSSGEQFVDELAQLSTSGLNITARRLTQTQEPWSCLTSVWTQLDVVESDYFGKAVALDDYGNMAIGDPDFSLGRGIVQVYQVGSSSPLGVIQGGAAGDNFGYSVDISSNRLFVGAPQYGNAAAKGKGYVRVYARLSRTYPSPASLNYFTTTTWRDVSKDLGVSDWSCPLFEGTCSTANVPINPLLTGQVEDGYFGHAVAYSGSGTPGTGRLVIGAPGGVGRVRIIDFTGRGTSCCSGSSYNKYRGAFSLHTDIEGDFDALGAAVSLSNDGYWLAVGAPAAGDDDTGRAVIYENVAGTFEQRFETPDLTGENEAVGHTVGLSGDGKLLVTGSPVAGNNAGIIRVFERGPDSLSLKRDWTGEPNEKLGSVVAISKTGGVVASISFSGATSVSLYGVYNEDQLADIDAQYTYDLEATNGVALSGDGRTVAIRVSRLPSTRYDAVIFSLACDECVAGGYVSADDECLACPAGKYLAGGDGACMPCGFGTYSTVGSSACAPCGSSPGQGYWDPMQSELTSKEACECLVGFTGSNCDVGVCADNTPAVSLGFLVIEVGWPLHARTFARNAAFAGISSALRSYDENGDDHLSVAEATKALSEGKMATESLPSHIWSSGTGADRITLDSSQITITKMIQDRLYQLETQQTLEFHEQPVDVPSLRPRVDATATITADYSLAPNVSTATCPDGYVLTSCSSYSPWRGTANGVSVVDNRTCAAAVSTAGRGVRAAARCVKYTDEVDWILVDGSSATDASVAQCPMNLYVTGCSCSSTNSGCDGGSKAVDERTCEAYAADGGSVVATALCVTRQEGWVAVEGDDSNPVNDARSRASCAVGYDLVGCSCYSANPASGGCEGAAIETENGQARCNAWNQDESSTVQAYAICITSIVTPPAISAMEATYPGPQMTQETCDDLRETAPLVEWTIERSGLAVFQQCAFFNGFAVASSNGLKRTVSSGGACGGDDPQQETCSFDYQSNDPSPVVQGRKQSYCVETLFCDKTPCTNTTVDPRLIVLRCTTGLWFDGEPADVFPRMQGGLGVQLSWLDTANEVNGYRVYKFADDDTPFVNDTTAILLVDIVLRKPSCGTTFRPLDFRDTSTGSEPGFGVSYAVVPLTMIEDETQAGVFVQAELKEKAGTSSLIVPWWASLRVAVTAGSEGAGPVKDVVTKLTRLLPDGSPDPFYTDFVVCVTDTFGECTLPIRVHDTDWSTLKQQFRVEVAKDTPRGKPHQFSPASTIIGVTHLTEALEVEFVDETSVSISGTVAHGSLAAKYFANDCPYTRGSGPGSECICSVDGAKLTITRSGGTVEDVAVGADGAFTTAVSLDENVTLALTPYSGSGETLHNFTVAHDAGENATVQEGQAPTFAYLADGDAEIHFVDTSTQPLSAALVLGAKSRPADYVTGVPIVAEVARCGWKAWAWTYKGFVNFGSLGATAYDVRTLAAGEIFDGYYYHPVESGATSVDSCGVISKGDVVENNATVRGCRVPIPKVDGTERRPCADMEFLYVDELLDGFTEEADLTDIASNMSNISRTVEFAFASPLCLAAVPVNGKRLQALLTHDSNREFYYVLESEEDLLLEPPQREGVDDEDLYGEACTNDTDAVFREGDALDLTFDMVDREPECYGEYLYPWNYPPLGLGCVGVRDVPATPIYPIAVEVKDGVSRREYESEVTDGSFTHDMLVGGPNPFSPFTHKIVIIFTRAFDGARIAFARHVMVVGVIPEEVPQIWTAATDNTLVFGVLRDPPGSSSFTALVEGSSLSSSMSIDGMHAAELADASEWGWNAGAKAGLDSFVGLGAGVEKNVLGVAGKHGVTEKGVSPDVTVDRGSSQHFDLSFSFSVGISTSTSPTLAGQPSDVILGGGANLVFIQSIEVYATAKGEDGAVCLGGRETKQFLPEQITTYVMSVYEIEKTIERLGDALRNPETTKLEGTENATVPDLQKEIENWQKVLTNYRATTVDSTVSITEQLGQVLNGLHASFTDFLEDTVDGKDADGSDLSNFLVSGLQQLTGTTQTPKNVKLPNAVKKFIPGVRPIVNAIEQSSGGVDAKGIRAYSHDLMPHVQRASEKCYAAAQLAPGDGLCDVYDRMIDRLELADNLLGICDFDNLDLPSLQMFCQEGDVSGQTVHAFDALSDTTQFVTFAGSTGLSFNWNLGESRGHGLTSKQKGNKVNTESTSSNFGAGFGRRRLSGGSASAMGPVLAVSKKILELSSTEKERRQLKPDSFLQSVSEFAADTAIGTLSDTEASKSKPSKAAVWDYGGAPCRRRRLGDRRLGVTACLVESEALTESYNLMLGRSMSQGTSHAHSVAVTMKDTNTQDVFSVRIAQDPVYGTPIFTTLGGRSSCPGETGTTKRDSGVEILEILPCCGNDCSVENSECKDLPHGEDAFFSVIINNLSPSKGRVKLFLRAAQGIAVPYFSGKGVADCFDGDLGPLNIKATDFQNVRAGAGVLLDLPYGQSEVEIKVYLPDSTSRCYTYDNIVLELVSTCEYVNGNSIQDVYQYKTSEADPVTGDFTVVHPEWIGRPTKVCGLIDIEPGPFEAPDGTSYLGGDNRWCYSALNQAVGCTASPPACWAMCQEEIDDGVDLKAIDWDESTGQCRCQDSCGCMVDDVSATFHVLLVDTLQPPTDEDGNIAYCADKAYNFKASTAALGPATSTATFSVSWVNEVPGCVYEAASNYNPAATKNDGSCLFPISGCTYAAATNYDSKATVDDDSCIFGAAFAPTLLEGSVCLEEGQSAENVELLKEAIAQLTGVSESQIEITFTDGSSCGGEERRKLAGASAYSYAIKTSPTETVPVTEKLDAMTEAELSAAMGGASVEGIQAPSQTVLVPTLAPTLTPVPTGPKAGCTYAAAENYKPGASIDDGSCEFAGEPGCTYAMAANFDPKATSDDGSCVFTKAPTRVPTSAPTPLEFPTCGVRVVRGNNPSDSYCETNKDAMMHNGLNIAFACCDVDDGVGNCDRHERGQSNNMCNAGRWNTEDFAWKSWLQAMKHCGAGRTLCDASEPCKGSGCSYDRIYQWTGEECQPGDANYPAACTPTPVPTTATMPQPTPWPTP